MGAGVEHHGSQSKSYIIPKNHLFMRRLKGLDLDPQTYAYNAKTLASHFGRWKQSYALMGLAFGFGFAYIAEWKTVFQYVPYINWHYKKDEE
ncbi:hypothetical protein B4U79_16349 [Dinothrombium tinctorium]|uniref:Uncharacterized protein n=1 Tax=Dinothrombium tinctorium TaxID=1965070 RepID=A0A3S3NSC4_9ACAR|nr:hypothetical protein B4U79_16349 [Dinothrombium tinctorium]